MWIAIRWGCDPRRGRIKPGGVDDALFRSHLPALRFEVSALFTALNVRLQGFRPGIGLFGWIDAQRWSVLRE
ncbi:MAG: hypothetical protein Fur0018_26790 [Anaerolineales bacterium]